MNVQEKEKQQKMIVQNIKGIESATAAAVTVKDTFGKKLKDLTMHGSQTYSQEFLEKEIQKVKSDFAAKMTTVNDDIANRLEELRTLIHDRDSVLDLSNPALTSALSLIQTIGSGITYEQATKINANFIHDQSSLTAIRDSYKARGVSNAGKIDSLIYNVEEVIEGLKKLAYDGFVRDGSINTFSAKLGKLATLEGTTVETLPDVQGFNDSVRRGAGLPV